MDDGNDRFRPRGGGPYYLNGRIMLTAVLSLSLVVIVLVVLRLYTKFALRRRVRDRQARVNGLGLIVNHVRSSEQPKGLDPTVIALLPKFVFKERNSQDAIVLECAVCLSMLEEMEMARILPNCKHIFHVECIDKWLTSNSTCPICRTEVEPPKRIMVPEHREGHVGTTIDVCFESALDSDVGGNKANESTSRLDSFKRMLSRDRSSTRLQYGAVHETFEAHTSDIERQ